MRPLIPAFCFVLATCLATADDAPPEPWLDVPSFDVPPAVLLSSAYAHPFPGDADVVVLLHESETEMDEQHRSTVRTRRVYRVLTPDGVRESSDIKLTYNPWYQERPRVRARVITPDAVSHDLEPDTLAESPFGTQTPNVYTEERLLAGPLPAVSVGSVVELEMVQQDKQPFFDAGIARWEQLRYAFPVRRLRVVIDVPSSLPLHLAIRGLSDVEATRSEQDGRVRRILELGPLEPLDDPEPSVPYDHVYLPYLSWSTGESWAAVARRYSKILEESLEGTNVDKLVKNALKGAETPEEKITAIVSRLHAEVRYTSVVFGQSGIVPAAPKTTLERKFGDCKDTAALLVAMLRTAGFQANVALVDSGVEPDLDIEMPGLGFFDHAIVHVVDPEIWIDSTTPHFRPGVLSLGVEDRIALIAAPHTTSTTRTPGLTPQGNRMVEIRDVFLAERGGARIVETTQSSGLQEAYFREWYASAEIEDQRDSLKSYVESFLVSDAEFQFEVTDPLDLGRPLEIRLEVEDAESAYSNPEQAVISIPTVLLTERLLEFLPALDSPTAENGESSRKSDFRVPWPYLFEWHYRIHPAPGFAAAPLPPENQTRWGPVTLTQRYSLEDDGSVNAVLTFDTGKRRWTPSELEEVWDGLERLDAEFGLFLSFEQVGAKHLAEGRIREALGEFRRLAVLHPDEALHRSEIAEALVTGGLGEAARVEAQRAVDLEPEDDGAYRTLGWVLLHDPVGRFLEKGCDPVAAETAIRKARELDPEDPDNRSYLAFLLSLDLRALGEDFPGPRLAEAIIEYRSMRDELDDGSNDLALAEALAQSSRFEELLLLINELPPSVERNSLWVAAVAGTEGIEAAFARAWSLASATEERQELIARAAFSLLGSRHYSQANQLLAKGLPKDTSGPEIAYLQDVFSRLVKHEDMKFGDKEGPESFLERLIIEMFVTRGHGDVRADHLAEIYNEFPEQVEDLGRFFRHQVRMMQSQAEALGVDAIDVGLDIFLAMTEWTIEGDAKNGYRCRVRFPVPGQEMQQTFYVVVEDGEHRTLGTDTDYWVLGLEAIRRLEGENIEAARRVLDWVYDSRPKRLSEDPLAVPAFLLLWDDDLAGVSEMRVAAAALVAGSPGSKTVLPILEEQLDSVADADRMKLDMALIAAYVKLERWEDTLAVARRLRAVHPDSEAGFRAEVGALMKLERWDDLSRVATDRLEDKKNDVAALQMLASAAMIREQRDENDALLRRIVGAGKAGPFEYNNLAWNRVEQGKVDAEAVDFAERATLYTDVPTAAAFHTLAAVYAEVERYTEARQAVLRSLVMRGAEEPGSIEWQIFGRIAEGYGEDEAAVLYYSRVGPPDGSDDDCEQCYSIAQARLKAMKAR